MHRDTFVLSTATTIDQYGQPTVTTSSQQGRIVHSAQRGRDVNGEDFMSTTQVQTLAIVNVGDRITIDGTTRTVRQVQRATGVHDGTTVTEAML